MPNVITAEVIKSAFFPVSTNKYWYYTAYFCMSFFAPALNHLLKTFPQQQLLRLVLAGAVLFSVYPTYLGEDLFYLNNGYSAAWLIYLYIIGGYLAKYPVKASFSALKCFLAAFAVTAVTFLQRLYPEYCGPLQDIALLRYHSPTVLACAVFLLIGFTRCTFPKPVCRTVGFLAPLCFGVYLLHAQGTVYVTFMKNKFGPLSQHHTVTMLLVVLATALFWFALGILADWSRKKLFGLLGINNLLKKLQTLEKRLCNRE